MGDEFEVEAKRTGPDSAEVHVRRVPNVGALVVVIVIFLVIASLVIAIALTPIAFPIALGITIHQHANKAIPVTDLVMTDSANVSWVTKSGYTNVYERDIPDGTYLDMTSYVEDGKTVVACATFQNQEDRKEFHGTVYYFKPSHVEQIAIIRVYADGKLAYDSGALGRDWRDFDINIEGVTEIRIEAHCTYSELNYYGEVVPAQLYFTGGLNK